VPFVIHGLPVSQGISIGHAHLVSHALLEVNHFQIAPRHVEAEVERIEDAAAKVRFELRALRETSSSAQSEVAAFVDKIGNVMVAIVKSGLNMLRTRRS